MARSVAQEKPLLSKRIFGYGGMSRVLRVEWMALAVSGVLLQIFTRLHQMLLCSDRYPGNTLA